MRTPRPASIGLIGVLAGLRLRGCGGGDSPHARSGDPLSAIAVRDVDVSTTFTEPPGIAVTYDPALVPVGSRVAVSAKSADGTTTVRLALRGLQTARRYGAHVHSAPCGATGASAGPTYQNVVDPVQPSVDPHTPTRRTRSGSTSAPTPTGRAARRPLWTGGSPPTGARIRSSCTPGRPRPRPGRPVRRAPRSAASPWVLRARTMGQRDRPDHASARSGSGRTPATPRSCWRRWPASPIPGSAGCAGSRAPGSTSAR